MDTLTATTIFAYGLASTLFLAFHAGLRTRAAQLGRLALAIGWTLQFIDIGVRCLHLQHPVSSAPEAMAFVSWMIAGGYLVASWRYKLDAAGAFAVPGALTLLVLARVVPADGGAVPPGALGIAHVFLATLGLATFALAAVLELVYLVQERRLKRKDFGRLRGGAAPLDMLDRLAARCVSFGFPVFTLAIVTGAIWVARLGGVHAGIRLRPEYVLALASWVAFGVLLVARAGAGWQGRRAAWLTVSGFGGVLLVMAGYLFRSVT